MMGEFLYVFRHSRKDDYHVMKIKTNRSSLIMKKLRNDKNFLVSGRSGINYNRRDEFMIMGEAQMWIKFRFDENQFNALMKCDWEMESITYEKIPKNLYKDC